MEQAKINVFNPHDPMTWIPGKEYLINGQTWALCGKRIRIQKFWCNPLCEQAWDRCLANRKGKTK